MYLFSDELNRQRNLLPYDGQVHYYGKLLGPSEADGFMNKLMETIRWENDKSRLFGKEIITKRKVAWYGTKPYAYTYSHITRHALPWTKELFSLKTLVETHTSETFNSCLLNLYHTGEEGMGWHSDAETELIKDGAIASLSLGSERKFAFKHKQSHEKVELLLEHGSLLVMKGSTQTFWVHKLPPTKKVTTPRINLTFRTIDA